VPASIVDGVSIHEMIGRAAECARLDELLHDSRSGRSTVLVLRGERGVGKTTLLDHAARRAGDCRVIRVRAAASEVEFAYAGLHLLCAPLLDELARLPPDQRGALERAVGQGSGPPPDPFPVAVAVLALFAGRAEERPLLCTIDDAQWLDEPSARVLAFVLRRLRRPPVAFLLAERAPGELAELADLPRLPLGGLAAADARALFASAVPGRVDPAVVDRIVAETHGNPAALLELVRGTTSAELAGGFGIPGTGRPDGRIDEDALARVGRLSPDGRRLLLAAAAEPTGDPTLMWRAANQLGIPAEAADPLVSAGLLTVGPRLTFQCPALRSAVYGLADREQRRQVHRALAAAIDPGTDPDRRAWHLARAADGPDDELAAELARLADRAGERAGLAAAGAFLAKAALLSRDPATRVDRALAAAEATTDAGNPKAAECLLATAELGPLDEVRRAGLGRQRARIALASGRGGESVELLLRAARALEPSRPGLARQTCLEALAVSVLTGEHTADVAAAAGDGPPAPLSPGGMDLLLDGLVTRFTKGYAAAVEPLTRALEALSAESSDDQADGQLGRWVWPVCEVAADLWDDEAWQALATRRIRLARESGAVLVLPAALGSLALLDVHRGDFAAAAARADEADAVTAALGVPASAAPRLVLAAWRGRPDPLAGARCDGGEELGPASVAGFAAAVRYNGFGRYAEALAAARDAVELDELALHGWALVELVEAATRAGQPGAATLACERLTERTRLLGTDWALGIEARSRALLAEGAEAEELYREAVRRLGRSRIKVHLARAQLLYGEWLRREGRRTEARVPLRAAHELLAVMGADAFAERAHRELRATGEKARGRSVETPERLTPQESRIAFLARDGLTNPEIGSRLFVSPRTVEYHLHKVFAKLGIRSRNELHLVLAEAEPSREMPCVNP
jgi:DNA-binding CsgD family transcriptional regulator